MNAKRALIGAAAALVGVVGCAQAGAADGVWRVGNSFVVRFDALDLARAEDRQELLAMVESAGRRLCRHEVGRAKREACAADAVAAALEAVGPDVARAVEQARAERAGRPSAES